MASKLTLTIDESVITVAKKYAKQKGKSLSGMVENYLKLLTSKEVKKETKIKDISPGILKLMGILDVPKNFNYKDELSKGLSKKYKL